MTWSRCRCLDSCRPSFVIARSACDEAIHSFLRRDGLRRFARNDGRLSEIGWLKASRFARLPVMKATAKTIHRPFPDIAARVDAIDWTQVTADLDGQGSAVLKGLL